MNVVEVHHLKWSFGGGDPYFEYGGWDGYPLKAKCDPFPGYAHNSSLVRYWADQIQNKLPLRSQITIYNAHYELLERCNGFAQDFGSSGSIVLSGKRQPINPAITRYLLPHEYGHHVQYALDRVDEDQTLENYIKLRPKAHTEYHARKWHSNIGELFANDCRILALRHETDYWPHPGFKHPFNCPDIIGYWEETVHRIKDEVL